MMGNVGLCPYFLSRLTPARREEWVASIESANVTGSGERARVGGRVRALPGESRATLADLERLRRSLARTTQPAAQHEASLVVAMRHL
jgi:hypothetical protein